MPKAIKWTVQMDAQILEMRGSHFSWDAIAHHFGCSRSTASIRGQVIGASLPDDHRTAAEVDRPPLPAGDVLSWGAINASTCLAGAAFVYAGGRV